MIKSVSLVNEPNWILDMIENQLDMMQVKMSKEIKTYYLLERELWEIKREFSQYMVRCERLRKRANVNIDRIKKQEDVNGERTERRVDGDF